METHQQVLILHIVYVGVDLFLEDVDEKIANDAKRHLSQTPITQHSTSQQKVF